ncbi:ATP-binding cassette domain-containing protein [Desulfotomaculum copahuensis]|uniref:ABC transporter n=1 Tax=Desulfotomaculum copahuensis TaxID=1838280 RepID=A0A1B7LEZ5_9FIRM|nr:ATP-binding cassette domain-containing protein [Desulfotomaculum copahuensis]OAT81828.1 ABC transporter [Desulfotomaculum copahuensis]
MLAVNVVKRLPVFTLQVELTVENEILAVLGPSGAGKTTLLQCLSGLQRPQQGEIILNGRVLYSSVSRTNLPPRCRRVGYVFQDYALFPHMTVEQNAAYGITGGRTGRAGEVGLHEVLEMLQITHLAGRYPGQISGGERQRTALARALLAGPELLLLDEPLSALDHETRLKVRGDLKSLQRRWGIPFILVTHDLDEAAFLGDRVIKLERGRVTGRGGAVKQHGEGSLVVG